MTHPSLLLTEITAAVVFLAVGSAVGGFRNREWTKGSKNADFTG